MAVESAFKADRDIPSDYPLAAEDQTAVLSVTTAVVQRLFRRAIRGEELEIEIRGRCYPATVERKPFRKLS